MILPQKAIPGHWGFSMVHAAQAQVPWGRCDAQPELSWSLDLCCFIVQAAWCRDVGVQKKLDLF